MRVSVWCCATGLRNSWYCICIDMDKTMKIKVIIALFLLIVVCALQLCCSQYAMKIEKVIIEREIEPVSDQNLIH